MSRSATGSYARPRNWSMPKTPIQAENVTASRFRKEMNKSMKLFATIISSVPRNRLIAAFVPTAQARGTRNPSVCAVNPAEYIDMALISTMPITATSRYGTEIQSGSNAPMKETGSRVTASPGVPTAITAPISTIGRNTIPAPLTVAATIARPDAVRGR